MKNTLLKRASVASAILSIAMINQADAQDFGRGFGPSPEALAAAKTQTESATSQMHAYLNSIAFRMLAKRADRVAAIKMKEEAVARSNDVRARIVELVGGIPPTSGPVNSRSFEQMKREVTGPND